jgi:hypothetical protein
MTMQIGVDSYDAKILMIHEDGKPFAFTRSKENALKIAAIPDMLEALESVYHQLATDSDLDNVSGAAKYVTLTKIVGQAIAAADPSNPQIRFNQFS